MENLVEISRFYGLNKEYIIAGGGNTSVKNAETMYIKASGFGLATISEAGFVPLDRHKLSKIKVADYSQDPLIREQEVKKDLMNSRIDSELRPSVESSLHDLINFRYVVHTHPTFINALLCSNQAEETVKEIFPEEYLYVKYVDPGYVLFKYVENAIETHRQKFGKQPQVILMQNHGVFVGADTTEEIKLIYHDLESTVKSRLKMTMPATSENLPALNKLMTMLKKIHEFDNHVILPHYHPLMHKFLTDREHFEAINGPFIPDHIVYCKAYPLFLDFNPEELTPETVKDHLHRYTQLHNYPPKIIYLKESGAVVIDPKESGATIIKDLVDDILLIAHHAQSFGGPRLLEPQDIDFIESWEVENYRRKLADKT